MHPELLRSPPSERCSARRALRLGVALASATVACRPTPEPAATPSEPTAVRASASLDDLEFMLGAWSMPTSDGQMTERWSQDDAGVMIGHGETIRDGAVFFFEELRIEARGDTVVYLARPRGREPAVEFRRTDDGRTAGTVTFENPAHDFPKRITYRVDDGRLVATVEGNGEREQWRYSRVQP